MNTMIAYFSKTYFIEKSNSALKTANVQGKALRESFPPLNRSPNA